MINSIVLHTLSAITLCLFASLPCSAQTGTSSSASARLPAPAVAMASGHISESAVGKVGQRQTRYQAAEGIAPTARIASRIQNRVQSRIRSRLDRDYYPQSNATSSFVVAEDTARTAGQSAH